MVQARGLSFHVAFAGPADAEPLVLLHGWPQHWLEWRKVLARALPHQALRAAGPQRPGLERRAAERL